MNGPVVILELHWWLSSKGDVGSIPGSRRSPGDENGRQEMKMGGRKSDEDYEGRHLLSHRTVVVVTLGVVRGHQARGLAIKFLFLKGPVFLPGKSQEQRNLAVHGISRFMGSQKSQIQPSD